MTPDGASEVDMSHLSPATLTEQDARALEDALQRTAQVRSVMQTPARFDSVRDMRTARSGRRAHRLGALREPREGDGARRRVRILQLSPAQVRAFERGRSTFDMRPAVIGLRPHRIARRATWRAEQLLDLATRAEQRGHLHWAARLLDLAVQCEG